MSLDAISSNDLFNFIIYDTISATPNTSHDHSRLLGDHNYIFSDEKCSKLHQDDCNNYPNQGGFGYCHPKANSSTGTRKRRPVEGEIDRATTPSQQGTKKKRKRKPKVCKNKEEAETQRMTHIAVERNRRKQMNEHLSMLRSLMPESYVQRGDQASIVGGAVEFVKELEHVLSTLEAKKLQVIQKEEEEEEEEEEEDQEEKIIKNNEEYSMRIRKLFSESAPIFATLLMQYSDDHQHQNSTNKYTSKCKASSAEIEVTLIETHANLRILSIRTHRQLLKLIAGLQALRLTVLHLNVTDFRPFVLYSISLKVEEGCQLRSVDDIAAAAHEMVRIIEEEAVLC